MLKKIFYGKNFTIELKSIKGCTITELSDISNINNPFEIGIVDAAALYLAIRGFLNFL